jgi:UDP-N-acetylglucosamine 3-dehydrogenase
MKVGILGTGFGYYHAILYSKIAAVDAIKIFGRNDEKLRKIEKDLQVATTNTIDDIILDKEIDLVDICLPSKLHKEYAIKALENGKDIFCETPVTLSLEDVVAIKEAAEKYNKKVFVNMFIKFHEAYQYIYTIKKENTLGKLKALHVRRKTPHLWGDLSLGTISPNLMIHEFDFVTWLLGMPNKISTLGVNSKDGESHVSALLSYDDSLVEVQSSYMMPKSYPFTVAYEALFEDGTVEYIENGYENRCERTLKCFTDKGMEVLELSNRDCYEESIKHVIMCFKENIPSLLSIDDAIDSLNVALTIRDLILPSLSK